MPPVLLAFVLWFTSAPLAAAPWYEHYERAEQALAAQEWRTAVEELNEALARRGDSGHRVRTYGMRVVDYFPYLKLGIAYHHLGNQTAALEAFATEVRLGAVAQAPEARAELDRYRGMVRDEEDRLARVAADRSEGIIRQALRSSSDREASGDWSGAMAALAPILADQPDHPEANTRLQRLGEKEAAQKRALQATADALRSLEAGRQRLDSGDAAGAARLLRESLDLKPSAEAEGLLAEARKAITQATQAEDKEANEVAARELAGWIADAGDLEGAGRLDEALEQLERVFAQEPNQSQAQLMRERILKKIDLARQTQSIDQGLKDADRLFEAGRWEESLAAANGVLALAPGRPEALEGVRRAYVEISRGLLARDPAGGQRENLPPAIRFADRRQLIDGESVEQTREPSLELSGVVIDRTAVTLLLQDETGREFGSAARSTTVGDLVLTEFRTSIEAPAGTSTWTLTATDAQGLTTRGEYRISYRRPWFRSPTLWALAVGLISAIGAGVLILQAGRRRKRLARRFNPYIAGGPVFDQKLFYGREPLMQRVLQTLHSNSLMLHGERRIGKTSLLHQLRHRLQDFDDPEYRFFPVYIDLQGTPEEQFFALLADQIHEALPPEITNADRLAALDRSDAYGHHDLIRELQRWIRALRAANERRIKVVLLIDEVDELNHYDPRVNQRLRSLFMKRFSESLVAVVAGVGIRKEWEREASPWYNFFEEIAVGRIAPQEAQRLVSDPLRGVIRLERGVAERIAEQTGGKPYDIQRRCLALVSRLHEEGRNTLTLRDCDEPETVGSP